MGRCRAAAAGFLAAAALSAQAQAQAPKADRQEDLKRVRERIEAVQAELARAEESRGEATDALKASEKAVSQANRELFRLSAADRELSSQVDELTQRSAAVRADIARQQELAARAARRAYESAGQDRLRVLLAGGDPTDIARQLAYLEYVQRARLAALKGLRESEKSLALLEQQLAGRREALRANREAQSLESRRLEKERAERAALVKRLASEVEKGRREVGRLKRDEQRLTRLVEEIARALAEKAARPPVQRDAGKGPGKSAPAPRGTPVEAVPDASASAKAFAALRGRMRLPVRGELTHRFGSPRDEGGSRWRGLFIRAATGEPVRAVADGRVVYADWLRGFGNLLILDHGAGYMSLYGYNDGLLRAVGESVRAGDAVAQVGSSGGAAETGLYFELRLDGKPFDPMTWVGR